MDIRHSSAVSGYIAQKGELRRTRENVPMLVMQLGQKQYRREPDRSFTLTGTGYLPVVLFGAPAEAVDQRFAVGDDVAALGEFMPRTFEREGQRVEVLEFRANKLLFDTTHPRYDVTRVPRETPATSRLSTGRSGPAPVPEDEAPERETAMSGIGR